MKIVYTVKPPAEDAVKAGTWFRRKARIVACGNLIDCFVRGRDLCGRGASRGCEIVIVNLKSEWMGGGRDRRDSSFSADPLSEVQCRQRILGQPPRVLVKAGLCEETELWEYTHAVYGLRESPRWWGEFRDSRLAQLNIVVGTRRIKLLQCRIEGSWWRLVEDSALVGIVVVYVDDLLICSIPPIVIAVSDAIRKLWDTSPLAWASDGIRFWALRSRRLVMDLL